MTLCKLSTVIVIDGLDRCLHDDPVSAFLSELTNMVDLPGVKMFITGKRKNPNSPNFQAQFIGTCPESHSLYQIKRVPRKLDMTVADIDAMMFMQTVSRYSLFR